MTVYALSGSLLAMVEQEPTPTWIIVAAFAVPVAIMALVLRWALRRRRNWKKSLRGQQERLQPDDVDLGGVNAITDPTSLSAEALLKAMAVAPEDHGPTADGMPHDEGWRGTMLGLRSQIATNTVVLNPHLYWGEHAGFQVFVRQGPDEKLEGSTTFVSERHLRTITVLRVGAPRFEIKSVDGRLNAGEGSSPEVRGAIAGIGAGQDVWGSVVVHGGPDGIVAVRPSPEDFTGTTWAYDLWLLEHLARTLGLEPLPKARIGPAWKVPYGLGRSNTPEYG
jgi:hypothetical protein